MLDIFKNFDWTFVENILFAIIPALICVTFHELSHGYVAYKLGDNTAKRMGRLTLNPIKHIDPIGLIMMVVFKFGWAKPVPVDMRNFKNPKSGMAITALAGPMSNIILAVIALIMYGALFGLLTGNTVGEIFLSLLYMLAYLSTALALFNLIPIPPLDGSKVLFSALSDESYYKLMRYERYGMLLLILVLATGVLGSPLQDAVTYIFNKLFYFSEIVFKIIY